jgi:hypothetical protein
MEKENPGYVRDLNDVDGRNDEAKLAIIMGAGEAQRDVQWRPRRLGKMQHWGRSRGSGAGY